MCKILTIAGINNSNREDAWILIKAMAREMSYSNHDGLGYSAITTENKMFGEKWLNNFEAFEKREALSDTESMLLQQYSPFFAKECKYKSFGTVSFDKIVAITLHTRLATSGKAFYNTHPFVESGVSLIHNGIISNWDKFKLKQSTCDSEALLRCYIDNDIANNATNIQKLANKIDGYYACAVFAKRKNGSRIMDIFKDGRAELEAAYIKELKLTIITTAYKDIDDAVRKIGNEHPDKSFTIETKFSVNHGKLLRIDPITGKVIKIFSFDPYKTKREKKKTEKSETLIHTSGVGWHSNGFHEDMDYGNEGKSATTNLPVSYLNNIKEYEFDGENKKWRRVNKKS